MRSRKTPHPGQYTIDFFSDDASVGGPQQPSDPIYFISFGSGSSGNSCYIGNPSGGVIVDAGIREEQISQTLLQNGITMGKVKGIILTHDHSDHVRYVYSMVRKHRHLRVYCTPKVLKGMLQRHNLSKRLKDFHTPIFKEIPFELGGFQITAFEVPHDGIDNMGFSLTYGGRNFVLATDLGEVQSRAEFYMRQANYLVIESNYDSDMLRNGRYPEKLKARIRTANGHMDNAATAAFLGRIIRPELTHIFLCHLSHDNNTPTKALMASRTVLQTCGLKVGSGFDDASDRACNVQLIALPRFEPTRKFIL